MYSRGVERRVGEVIGSVEKAVLQHGERPRGNRITEASGDSAARDSVMR